MGKHGGERPGAGRKKKVSTAIVRASPALANERALKLWQDDTTEQRWRELRDAKDLWLRFAVEKEIAHQACGKPAQRVALAGDKDKPLEVVVRVRHIGRNA